MGRRGVQILDFIPKIHPDTKNSCLFSINVDRGQHLWVKTGPKSKGGGLGEYKARATQKLKCWVFNSVNQTIDSN